VILINSGEANLRVASQIAAMVGIVRIPWFLSTFIAFKIASLSALVKNMPVSSAISTSSSSLYSYLNTKINERLSTSDFLKRR